MPLRAENVDTDQIVPARYLQKPRSDDFGPYLFRDLRFRADGSEKPVDVRTLPFVRFEDNEAHCDGLYGFNLGMGVDRVGPAHVGTR